MPMEIQGVVQQGVVAVDDAISLPEGAFVVVTYQQAPVLRVARNPVPVMLPIFDWGEPGTIDLTNDRIADILDRDDTSSYQRLAWSGFQATQAPRLGGRLVSFRWTRPVLFWPGDANGVSAARLESASDRM